MNGGTKKTGPLTLTTKVAILLFVIASLASAYGQSDEKLKAELLKAKSIVGMDTKGSPELNKQIEKIAPSFKIVPVAEGTSTNRFFKVNLNQQGAGFDGIRFQVSPRQDREFIWIFASNKKNPVIRWMITDSAGPLRGFQSFSQSTARSSKDPHAYFFGHAYDLMVPWGREADAYITVLHWNESVLKAGQEYWIWLEFKEVTPIELQGAITLLPAGTQLWSPQEREYALDLVRD
jgi:hypothetical protein